MTLPAVSGSLAYIGEKMDFPHQRILCRVGGNETHLSAFTNTACYIGWALYAAAWAPANERLPEPDALSLLESGHVRPTNVPVDDAAPAA